MLFATFDEVSYILWKFMRIKSPRNTKISEQSFKELGGQVNSHPTHDIVGEKSSCAVEGESGTTSPAKILNKRRK